SAAAQRGVRVGMPLSEATSLCQNAKPQIGKAMAAAPSARRTATRAKQQGGERFHLEPHDPAADLETLRQLAEQCEWFSPIVGLEQDTPLGAAGRPIAPECLLLDVSRLGHLFGGEASLAEQITGWFREQGYLAHAAVADTIGAAWAAVHEGPRGGWARASSDTVESRPLVLPAGHGWEPLYELPLRALRIAEPTIVLLRRLGVETIEQLRRLPRPGLISRFGEELPRRLDQASGDCPEVIVARRPPPEFTAEWVLEHPTTRRDSLDFVLTQLVERVSCLLASRGEGVVQLESWLETGTPEVASNGDGETVASDARPALQALRMRVDLFRPTANADHLMELLRMQMEALVLPGPVETARVEARVVAKLEQRQMELFADSSREATRQLSVLVDRLSARLGRQAVLRPRLRADAQPEQACYFVPLTGDARKLSGRAKTATAAAAKATRTAPRGKTSSPSPPLVSNPAVSSPAVTRPVHLETTPLSIQVVAVAPHGPPVRLIENGHPQRVLRHWGPERIETGWWRGPSIRRDYYRVETHTGERLWIFRRLQDGEWFLQGRFE
ncbi:MAG: DNA polymerase Y family protein, partial [Planctomycetales bacterium]|nr:DNA polymerase Y family protein [Planctomycetales bacterium]